ncbi:MAG: hypothetical protein MUF75_10115 [Bacteroidia bacterium]|nr:hypothetical protein [Bacteroidia bacterium]
MEKVKCIVRHFFSRNLLAIIAPLALIALSFVYVQKDVKQDLIVVHVQSASKTQFNQVVYAYHFLNGTYTGREEIVSVQSKKEGKDYIRFDRGNNVLYKNRYLITGIGNIVDVNEKKVLHDGKAKLMRCSNDSAIFYTNDIFKGRYYSVYNFSTHTYGEVKDLLFKTKYGRDVEYDKSTKPFKILYFPKDKPRIQLVNDAGYGQNRLKENYVPDPPLVWIDNDHFMYSHFNADNTEVEFHKVNVDTKNAERIGSVDIAEEYGTAEFLNLTTDQVIFKLGNKQVFIDMESGSISEQSFTKPENGFSFQCKPNPKVGRSIKLYGNEIGQYHFDSRNFVAGSNIAAFVREMRIGEDSYQQGLMVWNGTRKKWEAVEAEEVLALIGWINY